MISRTPTSTLFPTRRSSDLARAEPPDQAVRAPPHRVAQRREQARDRGGERRVCRRRAALRRRRRHRDRFDRSDVRSEEHTSELQSLAYLVCRLLLEKKKKHV